MKCWGYNWSGQLGNGGPPGKDRGPVEVVSLAGAVQITAGGANSRALVAGGAVKCWGDPSELGNGATTSSSTPVDVFGVAGATQITAGAGHACALVAGLSAKCWGRNSYGQLGNGTTTDSLTPVDVVGS